MGKGGTAGLGSRVPTPHSASHPVRARRGPSEPGRDEKVLLLGKQASWGCCSDCAGVQGPSQPPEQRRRQGPSATVQCPSSASVSVVCVCECTEVPQHTRLLPDSHAPKHCRGGRSQEQASHVSPLRRRHQPPPLGHSAPESRSHTPHPGLPHRHQLLVSTCQSFFQDGSMSHTLPHGLLRLTG